MGTGAALRRIEIQQEPLDVGELIGSVQDPSAGGTVVFIGTVRRDVDGAHAITALEYEAYGSMALAELHRIADGIQLDLPHVRIAVAHRIGKLRIGETAIVCAASAPHRAHAFEACRRLIDRIKERVPIFKREIGTGGSSWVGWDDSQG